jgi:hypothetical protein
MGKICLNMIVRNESSIIKRCLSNLIDIIDWIVITDTGSTDSTIQIINDFIAEHKPRISGKVYQDKWVNFAVNRTNSVSNAKKYLKSIRADLTNTYLLFIDADMIVEIDNFNKSDLKLDYYLVKQYNPYMSYYNTRLVRASLGLEYKSVTHEYLDINPPNATSDKIETIKINDIGDGGCKTLEGACSTDKFDRDIKLLTQGIVDEPENSRYYFYLAQSYKDIGDKTNAIKYYKLRADMGGWFEEVFYSYLMLGQITFPDSECVDYFTKSFEVSGKARAEPIYWLAKYWIEKKYYIKAYNYISQGLKIPYPSDQYLFINDSIYNINFFELLGKIAFYSGKMILGLYACDYIKFISDRPNEEFKQIQTYYLNKLNPQGETEILNPGPLPENFNPSNCNFKLVKPGICEGILRTVNYTMDIEGNYTYDQYIETKNFWCVVDIKKNSIISKKPIELTDSTYLYVNQPHNSEIKGIEDGRFIIYKNKLYASFVSLEYGLNQIHSIVLAHINSNFKITHLVPLRYLNNLVQKNWLPVIYKDKLCFIYSYDPFILLHVDIYSGYCKELIKATYNVNLKTFRGSAGPVTIPNKNKVGQRSLTQLVLIHEVGFDREKGNSRTYYHRFLEFDENFHLLRMSEPFYFDTLGIEFSLTLIYIESTNQILIYHTIRDNKINKVLIDYNSIRWLPCDLKEAIISNL